MKNQSQRQALIRAIGGEVARLQSAGMALPPDLAAQWAKYSVEYRPAPNPSLPKAVDSLSAEIRAARQAVESGGQAESMAVFNADKFNALIERFDMLINSLAQQAPPTVVVTNEVKPAPVTVVQQSPRFTTEETTIKRGNNGEMLGSVTRATHEYVKGD